MIPCKNRKIYKGKEIIIYMKTIILSGGEIGKSLYGVLSKEYECAIYDINLDKCVGNYGEDRNFEIMHVCIPYSDNFIKQVEEYKNKYKPKYVVIHSTVPVGTSRKVGAMHSPVVGIHPNLSKSLITFTKFLGGLQASEVADYFRRASIKVYLTDKQETTEYMKIMSTTFYGVMIEFHKQVKEDCRNLELPFEMFTLWNDNYNKGYEKLGYPEYKKPILVPMMKKISQHCVLPNTYFLENDFTKLLKNRNNEKSK